MSINRKAKVGGVGAVVVTLFFGLAKLINAVTSEHTVANHVTDDILAVGCVVLQCEQKGPAELK